MKLFRFSCLPVKAHGFVLEYPGQSAHFIHEAVTGSVTVTGFSGKQIAVPEDVYKRQGLTYFQYAFPFIPLLIYGVCLIITPIIISAICLKIQWGCRLLRWDRKPFALGHLR